jgi:IS30 family transposase
VFGLPKALDGSKGILVIIEQLTKYPYAVPIKSKEATEIAKHLFEYITLFGAPREIISDQGKEFVIQVVTELTNAAGITHNITSTYNPRCNGQTERFNGSLIESLRMICDKDN